MEVRVHACVPPVDQAFALQWVQDQIGLFGGDKARVTIWGQSAGAGSVLQHIVANGGDTQPPLFNAAIVSSTFLPSQYYYNDPVPQSLYNQVVAMTGCASSDRTFDCLQSVDAKTLEAVDHDLVQSAFHGTYVFAPVVDGTLIVERPTVTLARGRVNGHVLLAVTNENEGTPFVNPNETLTITEYISGLFPDMSPIEVEEVAAVYEGYGNAVEQAIIVMGDCRSWKGLFAIPPAYHADDLAYYFYSSSGPPPYNNTEFIPAFSQSFMSVAKYDDVNMKLDPTNITPLWDTYSVRKTEMLFNRTKAGAPVVSPIHTDQELLRRCAFWASMTSSTAQ